MTGYIDHPEHAEFEPVPTLDLQAFETHLSFELDPAFEPHIIDTVESKRLFVESHRLDDQWNNRGLTLEQ